jgi:hypothetical protein
MVAAALKFVLVPIRSITSIGAHQLHVYTVHSTEYQLTTNYHVGASSGSHGIEIIRHGCGTEFMDDWSGITGYNTWQTRLWKLLQTLPQLCESLNYAHKDDSSFQQ